MQLAPSIFKAYDIRGVVPSTVDEAVAEGIGRAFGTIARKEGETTVAVGRDGRLSGPSLSGALMRGLVAAGLEVIDVGMVTTPMLYFAANTLCTSGIQVTGSHNPKDYNGFKMVMRGRAIYGDEIQAIHAMMANETWLLQDGGSMRQVDVLAAYRERIVGDIKLARPMKIVVDSGNGIAGASAPAILRAIGCEVIELFSAVDGNFPNHHPDPSKPENLRDLIQALRDTRAELAVRPRCAHACAGRHHPVRREMLAAPGAGDRGRRRRGTDVQDRPFADQGEDEGHRGRRQGSPAGRRDERAHLFQGALVRL